MPARYEYVNGNIKYIHEYAYTTGELPSNPIKTTEYHYEDSTWADVLTGVSQYRYTTSNTSTYGLRNNSSSSFEEYVRSILGDDLGDYEIVDLGSRALLNLEPENSNTSTYSLPGNANLRFSYSVESDAIGNITYIDGIEIEWDGRRAVAVQQGDNTITYEYNIDGQRTKKTVNGVTTEYFYNGDILAGQKTGNDTIIFMYDNNGDIFGFEYNGTPYYYVKNAQNDVVMVLNCNDRTAVVYQYDAWGNITDVYDSTTQRVSNINPITYRSYYYDIEMGVYYLNSRYYVPIICRFLSADGIVDTQTGVLSHNMFAYCNNNPVNMIDSDGTEPLWTLIKNACKKIYKIFTGKEYEKKSITKTTFDTTKTLINGVSSYGEACDNAQSEYRIQIENVVNSHSNFDVELKSFNHKRLNLSPTTNSADAAYQGMWAHALGKGYNLNNMTWEDVKKHPELEKELVGIYCIWDQASARSIAIVYGVDWSVENGAVIFFK